jgi:hypothetical protein
MRKQKISSEVSWPFSEIAVMDLTDVRYDNTPTADIYL